MNPIILDSFFGELEKSTEDAIVKEAWRKCWKVSNTREGRRSISVDKLLKKEKDGTLGGVKLGAAGPFYGTPVPFSDVGDQGAAARKPKKKGEIPSREDIEAQSPKREDGRDFLRTEVGPQTTLTDITATENR